jgi:hypothetical protein
MDQNKNQGQDKNQEQTKDQDKNQGQDKGQGQGGGVTNRPLDREQKEQDELPPRGQTKDEKRNA